MCFSCSLIGCTSILRAKGATKQPSPIEVPLMGTSIAHDVRWDTPLVVEDTLTNTHIPARRRHTPTPLSLTVVSRFRYRKSFGCRGLSQAESGARHLIRVP